MTEPDERPSRAWRIALAAARLAQADDLARELSWWSDTGLTPSEALAWRSEGWRAGPGAEQLVEWHRRGFTPIDGSRLAGLYAATGFTAAQALNWHDTLSRVLPSMHADDVAHVAAGWCHNGLRPDTAARYLHHHGADELPGFARTTWAAQLAVDARDHRNDLYGPYLAVGSPWSLYDAPAPMDDLDRALLEPELRDLDDRYARFGIPPADRPEWDRVLHAALGRYGHALDAVSGEGWVDDLYPAIAAGFCNQQLGPSVAERQLLILLAPPSGTERDLEAFRYARDWVPQWARHDIELNADQISPAPPVLDLRHQVSAQDLLAQLPPPRNPSAPVPDRDLGMGVER